MTEIAMQSNVNDARTPTRATMNRIARLESEIDAKRAEIDRLRMDDLFGDEARDEVAEENRDETEASSSVRTETDLRQDSFGEIVVLWEQPVSDGPCGSKNVVSGDENRAPAEGAPRQSTDASPDVVYLSSDESEETSAASAKSYPHTPNPQSPPARRNLLDQLLRPFTPLENEVQPTGTPPPPRRTNGLLEHLLIPLSSPGSRDESLSELELLKMEIHERDLKLRAREDRISTDIEVMRRMNDTIQRMSTELLRAKRAEQMLAALASRSSSLEDEVEELRVENTRLRIASRMLEDEKRRVERDMTTELELLHLEASQRYFEC